MEPKEAFDATIMRAERLLHLYRLLCNTRKYKTRRDWAHNFKKVMGWRQAEAIHRVDGTGALLVLRQTSGLTSEEFCPEELSELLRAALVTALSALDRYCHEVLVSRVIARVQRAERNWPAELKKVSIPLSSVKEAVKHAKVRKGVGGKVRTRPMNIVRRCLQDQFHRRLTLQKPDDIARTLSMVGVTDLWAQCAKAMSIKVSALMRRLQQIAERRDVIAHEGDLKRVRRAGKPTLNPIEPADVRSDVEWLKKLVDTMDTVIG